MSGYFMPDTEFMSLTKQSFTANTMKTIPIPKGTIGIHYFPVSVNTVVFFNIDGNIAVPTGTPTKGGFFAPYEEAARILAKYPLEDGHELNMISTTVGDFYLEFFGYF
jgi:hypothetical protein